MNTLTQIKPKQDYNQLRSLLLKAETSQQQQAQQKAAQLKRIALSDPKAWAAGAVNDEIGLHLSQLGTDAMYRMAAIAEGMLGYYLDYYREVEKVELDFTPRLEAMHLSKKERRELVEALKWAKEKLEKNFANFYLTNKQMVDMCSRVDKAQQEKLQEIEEAIYDEVVVAYNTKDSKIENWIQPGREVLASCEEICANLCIWSKGAIYRTPQKIRKELEALGLEKEGSKYYYQLVK